MSDKIENQNKDHQQQGAPSVSPSRRSSTDSSIEMVDRSIEVQQDQQPSTSDKPISQQNPPPPSETVSMPAISSGSDHKETVSDKPKQEDNSNQAKLNQDQQKPLENKSGPLSADNLSELIDRQRSIVEDIEMSLEVLQREQTKELEYDDEEDDDELTSLSSSSSSISSVCSSTDSSSDIEELPEYLMRFPKKKIETEKEIKELKRKLQLLKSELSSVTGRLHGADGKLIHSGPNSDIIYPSLGGLTSLPAGSSQVVESSGQLPMEAEQAQTSQAKTQAQTQNPVIIKIPTQPKNPEEPTVNLTNRMRQLQFDEPPSDQMEEDESLLSVSELALMCDLLDGKLEKLNKRDHDARKLMKQIGSFRRDINIMSKLDATRQMKQLKNHVDELCSKKKIQEKSKELHLMDKRHNRFLKSHHDHHDHHNLHYKHHGMRHHAHHGPPGPPHHHRHHHPKHHHDLNKPTLTPSPPSPPHGSHPHSHYHHHHHREPECHFRGKYMHHHSDNTGESHLERRMRKRAMRAALHAAKRAAYYNVIIQKHQRYLQQAQTTFDQINQNRNADDELSSQNLDFSSTSRGRHGRFSSSTGGEPRHSRRHRLRHVQKEVLNDILATTNKAVITGYKLASSGVNMALDKLQEMDHQRSQANANTSAGANAGSTVPAANPLIDLINQVTDLATQAIRPVCQQVASASAHNRQ